jgi:ubiquinone/menaquinone biosynthesis C-methylase UbiE
MANFSKLFSDIPAALVAKVNGDTTETGFRHIGFHIAEGIERELPPVLGSKESRLRQCDRILEFGSGLGRVILQLLERVPKAEIVGFDIDPMMNRWTGHLFPDKRLKLVSSTLDLPDGSFDLIIIVSVFTHLDQTTDFWLSEVHRLLSKTGYAFITYHDDTLFMEMQAKGQFPSSKLEGKFVAGHGTAEGGAAMGTFYTTPYWKQVLEKYFNVDVLKPRGLFRHQSISVVSRKDIRIDREALYRTYMATLEHEIYELRRTHEIHY